MKSEKAHDVQERLMELLRSGEFPHVNAYRIICMRSRGAKARAYARIWSMPSIWQSALEIEPFYIIEVLSEHFDKLEEQRKDRVLIHELLHIPKKFSGGLVPHRCFGKKIDEKRVEEIYERIKRG
ncbi:metallopeptidase [Candidatus Micrarchaeota archaeon]|nr:MAG: metallopeptidase [Candidatus Micrarchaeota archaeon]